MTNSNTKPKSATLIETDRGTEDVVDLLARGVKSVRIKVSNNNFRPIRVADIPVSIYHLECGCTGKGIAVREGNVFFCEAHADHFPVVDIRA